LKEKHQSNEHSEFDNSRQMLFNIGSISPRQLVASDSCDVSLNNDDQELEANELRSQQFHQNVITKSYKEIFIDEVVDEEEELKEELKEPGSGGQIMLASVADVLRCFEIGGPQVQADSSQELRLQMLHSTGQIKYEPLRHDRGMDSHFFTPNFNSRLISSPQIQLVNEEEPVSGKEEVKVGRPSALQNELSLYIPKQDSSTVLQQVETLSVLKASEKPSEKFCYCTDSILIVDDNMFNLVPLELLLGEFFEISVEKAGNGKEAVELFA